MGKAPAPMHVAPTDYTQFVDEYFDYIKQVVASHNIDPQNVEDVASDIVLKFFEKDALSWYDPGKVFSTASGPRTASFKTLLKTFVDRYVLTPRDKQNRLAKREPIRTETPIASADGASRLWLDVFGPTTALPEDAIAAEMDLAETLRAAMARVKAIPTSNVRRDHAGLFQALVRRSLSAEPVTGLVLAKEVGVSDTVVYAMLRDIRQALRDLGLDAWLRESTAAA